MKFLHSKFALATLCSAMTVAGNSYAGSVEDQIRELQARMAEMNKTIEALQAKVKAQPKIKTTGGGLRIADKQTGGSFKLNGRLHLDYDGFDGAYNAKAGGGTGSDLFARRARLGASGKLNEDFSYQLVLAFGGDAENGRIQNAILSYNGWKRQGGPQIQLGKIKEDLTLDGTISSNHITAISRPAIVNSVHPFFNWGVRVNQHFKDSGLRYAFGVYQAEDAGFTEGKEANDNGRDNGAGSSLLAFTGRVNWAPLSEPGKVLHLGAWGSHRDFGGEMLNDVVARGEVRNTAVRLLDYGANPELDSITQYGVEFGGVAGPFSLQGEYIKRQTEAASSGGFEPDLDGYYATASYFLTGESRSYDAAKGVFKQPKGVKNAWEVFVRHSNADATNSFNGTDYGTEVDITSVGVTYYMNSQLRFMLNYLDADAGGPGVSTDLQGEDGGKAITFRTHYMF